MYFKWLKKVGAGLLAIVLAVGTQILIPASAAEKNIEIILEEVTKDDQSTLRGEAKIKVSVRGAGGNVTAAQVALKFSGKLKYKSIEFLQGKNNPPECLHISPNAALANSEGKILPSIATNYAGSLTFTDDVTDLFIITFAGEPGDSVTVSVNNESAAGTWCAIDGGFVTTKADAQVSEQAIASSENNEGIPAIVTLTMDVVNDFTVSNGNGYADSKLALTITKEDEQTSSTISTALNTVSLSNGGHYDSTLFIPTFVVENTVISGYTYTVELTGKGYVSYRQTGVDFTKALELTNADLIPGDINSDGTVDMADKLIYQAIIAGENGECADFNLDGKLEDKEYEEETDGVKVTVVGADLAIYRDILSGVYDEYADFNRDGRVDNYDDVFGGIKDETKTAPEKMSKPSVSGGDKKITVSWTAPENGGSKITGYTIKYGTSSINLNKTQEVVGANITSKTISGLTADTNYYVKIAAKNEIGHGEYSDIATAKTNIDMGAGMGFIGGITSDNDSPSTDTNTQTGTTEAVVPSTTETFTDLGNYGWAKDAIYTLKNKGIINGISETEYAPANNIKRGDFILILTRMLSINDAFTQNFADVPASSYYYNAIGSAKVAGIAQGNGENFMPENTITRQDLITLAYRAFLAKGYITETNDMTSLDVFADKDGISDYAKTAMASMVKAGIIQGSDGNVNPLGFATRAEVAVMCARLLELMD